MSVCVMKLSTLATAAIVCLNNSVMVHSLVFLALFPLKFTSPFSISFPVHCSVDKYGNNFHSLSFDV